MARKPTVLVVGNEDSRVGMILRELSRLESAAVRHLESLDDVFSVVEPGVLVVAPSTVDDAPEIAGLIACLGVTLGACPVVVVSPAYDQEQALMYFRVGATDYLGLDVHLDRLAPVVASLLGPVVADAPSESDRKIARPARPGKFRRASPIA